MSLLNVGVNVMDRWDKKEASIIFIPRKRLYIAFGFAGLIGFITAFIVMDAINLIKSF